MKTIEERINEYLQLLEQEVKETKTKLDNIISTTNNIKTN